MTGTKFDSPADVSYFRDFSVTGEAQWADANHLSVRDAVLLAISNYTEGEQPYLVGSEINMRGIEVIRDYARTAGITAD